MILEEAITHLEDTLSDDNHDWGCVECRKEHEQLLSWLKELKDLRESLAIIQNIERVTMKDLTAEEKQHFFDVWKDAKLQIIDET